MIVGRQSEAMHNKIFVFLRAWFSVFLSSFIRYKVVVVDRANAVCVDKPSFRIEIMGLATFEACWRVCVRGVPADWITRDILPILWISVRLCRNYPQRCYLTSGEWPGFLGYPRFMAEELWRLVKKADTCRISKCSGRPGAGFSEGLSGCAKSDRKRSR